MNDDHLFDHPQPPSSPPAEYSPHLGGSGTGASSEPPNFGSGAQPEPNGGGRDRRGSGVEWVWVAAGLGALVVVLVIALLAALLVDKRGKSDTAAPTVTQPVAVTTSPSAPPTSTESSPTTEPAGSVTTAAGGPSTTEAPGGGSGSTSPPTTGSVGPATTKEVDDIEAFVAKTRGLKFKTKPKVQFASPAEFSRALLAEFDKDAKEMEKQSVGFRALGLIPANTNYAETMRAVLDVGVVGFYDPETKVLMVKGSALTPYTRTVVAHELTHALDDQYFNLNRPNLDKATDESGYGFTALVEGSASVVEKAYRKTYSTSEEAQASQEETAAGSDPRLFTLPIDLIKLVSAPYEQGPLLISAITAKGGQKALDGDFAKPPISSEQVLTPQKYLDGDTPVKVAKPKFTGKEVDSGSMGQFLLTILMQNDFTVDLTHPAPETVGWAGDQYVSYTDPNKGDCISFDVKMDSNNEASNLQRGLRRWVAKVPDAQLRQSGDVVSATSCVKPPASSGNGNGA